MVATQLALYSKLLKMNLKIVPCLGVIVFHAVLTVPTLWFPNMTLQLLTLWKKCKCVRCWLSMSYRPYCGPSHALHSFFEFLDLNIDNLCIDLFFTSEKSSKRKDSLTEYFEFCDQEYEFLLKYVSVRWLSLEGCMGRIYTFILSYLKALAKNILEDFLNVSIFPTSWVIVTLPGKCNPHFSSP